MYSPRQKCVFARMNFRSQSSQYPSQFLIFEIIEREIVKFLFLQNRRKTSIFVPRFKIISNRYRNDKTFFLKLSSSHGGETLENKCKEFLSRPTVRVHTRATFKEWKGKRRSPAPSLVPRLRTEDNKFIFNLSDSRLIYQRRPSVDRGAHLR